MKLCISCGMPMTEISDFAMGDVKKDYCTDCANPDGSMQTFDEKRAELADLIVKTQGFDRDAALKTAENMMRTHPAWRK